MFSFCITWSMLSKMRVSAWLTCSSDCSQPKQPEGDSAPAAISVPRAQRPRSFACLTMGMIRTNCRSSLRRPCSQTIKG